MALSVIGAGLGRTGTLSLKFALEQLGLGPCYHMMEVFKIPAAPGQWLRAARGEAMDSTQATIFRVENHAGAPPEWLEMFDALIGKKFDGRLHDRDHCIAVYEAHNDEVARTIPPDRLLIYEPGQGWEPLCHFLDVPEPDTPYPKVNSTEEFQARVAARTPQ